MDLSLAYLFPHPVLVRLAPFKTSPAVLNLFFFNVLPFESWRLLVKRWVYLALFHLFFLCLQTTVMGSVENTH